MSTTQPSFPRFFGDPNDKSIIRFDDKASKGFWVVDCTGRLEDRTGDESAAFTLESTKWHAELWLEIPANDPRILALPERLRNPKGPPVLEEIPATLIRDVPTPITYPPSTPPPIRISVGISESHLLSQWLRWHEISHEIRIINMSLHLYIIPPATCIGVFKVPVDKAWALAYAAFTRPRSIDNFPFF